MAQTYFAILVAAHAHPVPAGLKEPHGVFTSLEVANEYLIEAQEEWNDQVGVFPFTVRAYEYSTMRDAELADVGDGNGLAPHKPLAIHEWHLVGEDRDSVAIIVSWWGYLPFEDRAR